MSDLASIYNAILAAGPKGNEFSQGLMAGSSAANEALKRQQLMEEMEAQRGLRKLFAENPNPSMEQIGQYSPEFAMKMPMLNLDIAAKQAQIGQAQAGTQKTQQEISESQRKVVANAAGPAVEEWLRTGDTEAYNRSMGKIASDLSAMGVPIPKNFDAQEHNPLTMLSNVVANGYTSPWLQNYFKFQQEEQLSNLPPRMSPTQAFGEVRPNPVTGQPEMIPPIARPQRPMPMGQATAPAPMESQYEVATTPEQMTGFAKKIPMAGTTDIAAEEQKIASAKETGKLQAEEAVADRKAVDNYFRGRPPEEVRNLIKESISGDTQSGLQKLGQLIGVAVPGSSPQAALKVITQQLAKTSPFAPGSQSDKEYQARLEAIGNPSSTAPIPDRLAALDEFYREQEAFIAQKANLTDEELLDKVKSGYISKETALEIRRRMQRGK